MSHGKGLKKIGVVISFSEQQKIIRNGHCSSYKENEYGSLYYTQNHSRLLSHVF